VQRTHRPNEWSTDRFDRRSNRDRRALGHRGRFFALQVAEQAPKAYGAIPNAGVIGFAGTKDKPIPMRKSEVDNMLAQMREREEKVKPKVSFEVGETVKVADGPFQNQNGIVEEIDPDRGKLRVSVTIFGRATPVELEYWQVERG